MKTATALRLVSTGPKRSFIELTDSGRAIAGEQWVPCPGYESRYEVSSLGRVRSLPRTELTELGHKRVVRGCILTAHRNTDGYLHVPMRRGGKLRLERIHRLVAIAFHSEQRNALHCEVAHLDGNRGNARADNLKWVSRVENRSHRKLHGTDCDGERHASSKLTNEQAKEICRLRGKLTREELAGRYRVSRYTIEDVQRGRRYRSATEDCRPSHIAVTNTRLFTVRSHKPPVPRGHKQWIGDKR